jgi:hypothetical protein
MKNRIIALVVGMVLLLLSSLTADPYSEPAYPHEESHCMWFDSLNVRFIGNWPFGPSHAVAYDSVRRLVFCGSGGGVYILDLSVPSAPVKLSELVQTRGIVYGLSYELSNSMLYIADGIAGLEIWDISNPSFPTIVGSWDTPGQANGVTVSGSYAYVADADSGLRVIDVSIPSNPTEVGYCDTPDDARDVAVSGSYAYVADGTAGLRVIDVSSPSNPTEVGYYDTPDIAVGVAVSGYYAYVADFRAGLQIYEFLGVGVEEEKPTPCPDKIRLLQNPVSGNHIELLLTSPEDVHSEITLYNQIGQRLKIYQFSGLKSGENRLRLDARGLPAGIYFLEATIGDHIETRKLIKII